MLHLLSVIAAAASGSPIASLSDQQLCAVMKEQATKLVGTKTGDATVTQTAADCGKKVIGALYRVDLPANRAPDYIKQFILGAHTNVCRSGNPTMRAIVARGWQYSYSFAFRGASIANVRLNCKVRYST